MFDDRVRVDEIIRSSSNVGRQIAHVAQVEVDPIRKYLARLAWIKIHHVYVSGANWRATPVLHGAAEIEQRHRVDGGE